MRHLRYSIDDDPDDVTTWAWCGLVVLREDSSARLLETTCVECRDAYDATVQRLVRMLRVAPDPPLRLLPDA